MNVVSVHSTLNSAESKNKTQTLVMNMEQLLMRPETKLKCEDDHLFCKALPHNSVLNTSK